MKSTKKRILLLSTLLTIFAVSCNIGLGPAVDLDPPKLTIISPEISQSVNRIIELSGYAEDKMAVTSINVVIDQTELEFKWEGDTWYKKEGDNFVPYINGISTNTSTRVDFTLFIEIEGKKSGEDLTIITQANDELGNQGGNSKDERKVTLDIQEPIVSIAEPVLEFNYNLAKQNFEGYKLQENAVLSNLLNKDITFSGSQKEDTKLKKLTVYLDEDTKSTLPENEEEITNTIYKEVFEGSGIRNWNFIMKEENLPETYKTGKHLIRVFTYSYDTAGNCEHKVHGWFTYWNEADKPWVAISFGEDDLKNLKEENQTYPNAQLLGQSYDDDGIKSVSIKTVKITTKNNEITSETEVPELTKIIDLEAEGYPKYYSWSTFAIGDLGKFYIDVSCIDINDNESSTIRKYFEVADITPPTIIIENDQDLKLPLNDSKFAIKGVLKDDGGAQKLMMVRISGTLSDANRIEYLNGYKSGEGAEDLIWNKGDVGGGKDKFGNSIWILDDSKLGKAKQVNDGIERAFEFNLDWQNDLGIKKDLSSTEKLISQTFILCVIDGQNLSGIKQITFAGDSERPSLTIEKIQVYKDSNVVEERNWDNGNPTLSPYDRDADVTILNKLVFSGKWSDNSSYTSKISFKWQDYLEANEITITKNDDGTWKSSPVTPQDKMTSVIEASIVDIGGNSTSVTKNFTVDGAIGQYSRISSETENGSYKAEKEIDIYIQFTKPVTFKDGSEDPYLVLNNGGIAKYFSGNGTEEKQTFKYKVGANDTCTTEIEPLKVETIITNGNKWYDGSNVIWNKQNKDIILATELSLNLNVNRKIIIDTVKPKLESLQVTTAKGSYGKGKTINIIGTFSEEVLNTSDLQLTLNTGKTTSKATSQGGNSKVVTFTYEVQEGDNVSALSVNNITFGSITDKAGNSINTALPNYIGFADIQLDTKTPTTPTITVTPSLTGSGSKKVIYSNEEVNVKITFDSSETTGNKKYTISYNGSSTNWTKTTSNEFTQTLGNGEYKISAYQEDSAGNKSLEASVVEFNVNKGHILKSVKVNKPSGDYIKGTELNYTVTFRIPVTSSDSTLTLGNTTKSDYKTLSRDTVSSDNKVFTYKYTVAEGDDFKDLYVTGLTGTFKDEFNNEINAYVTLAGLIDDIKEGKIINILKNSNPKVQRVELSYDNNNNQILTIEYDQEISKNSVEKEVVLEMTDAYKAPVYFTKEQWNNYSDDPTIKNYYESNTLGCDKDYNPDLTEKFVLKFGKNTTDTTLTNALKGKNAHKASLSVNSSDVSIGGTQKNQLIMNFKNKIPVKGATYKVTIPAEIVQNKKNTKSDTSADKSVTLPGVEEPVIRIQKSNEWVEGGTIKQPTTAKVKIDCQTPGATVKYKTATAIGSEIVMKQSGNNNATGTVKLQIGNTDVSSDPNHTFSFGDYTTLSTDSLSFNLSAGNGNDQKGCEIRIQAVSEKTVQGTNYSENAYESATKTVIILKRGKDVEKGDATDYSYRAIRGGDATYGAVSTPNFPFSWNTEEIDKIRVMTGNGNTKNSSCYLITWKLTTTAYINILAVDNTAINNTETVEGNNEPRPTNWWWASCGWVPDIENHPIYPGETTTLDVDVLNNKNGGFAFQEKHKQSATSPSLSE